MSSASDVRAGAAYYELYAKDGVTPALAKARATVQAFGKFLEHFSPGAGGSGFFNRLVFGAKEFDSKTGQYKGRVGGLIAPIRALLAPIGNPLGLVGRWLFGDKVFDAESGKLVERAGGKLGWLRRLVTPLADGSGWLNRWLFGRKQFDRETGAYVGRVGGLLDLSRSAGGALARTFAGAAAGASALVGHLRSAGAALAAFGAGAAVPFVALFKGGLDRGAEVARLSRQLGVPIEKLHRLKYAADAAGVSLEEVMGDRTGRYADLINRAPPIDADAARAAAAAQLELSDATRALQDALLPLARAMLPYLKHLGVWVKQNAHLIAPLALGVGLLGALGAAAGIAALAVYGLGSAVGFVIAVVKGLAAIVFSPLGAILAVVGAIGYVFFTMTESGRKAGSALRGEFRTLLGDVKTTWGGIAAALKKGDLEGALKIAGAGLELIWARIMLRFEQGWAKFKAFFVDGWHELTFGLGPILSQLWDQVRATFDRIVGGVRQAVQWIRETLSGIWDAVKAPLMRVAAFLKPFIAVLAAPWLGMLKVVKEVWNALDTNLLITIINISAGIEKVFKRVGGTVENVFRDMLGKVLDYAIKAAKGLESITPDALAGDLKKGIAEAEKLRNQVGQRRDVDQEVADIETRRARDVGGIKDRIAAEELKRAMGRGKDIDAAERRVTDAEKRLNDLVAGAQNTDREGGALGALGAQRLPPIRPELLGGVEVKGGFSGAALGQQFGYGDKVVKMTELLKQLVDGQGKLPPEIARQLAPMVGAPPVR